MTLSSSIFCDVESVYDQHPPVLRISVLLDLVTAEQLSCPEVMVQVNMAVGIQQVDDLILWKKTKHKKHSC